MQNGQILFGLRGFRFGKLHGLFRIEQFDYIDLKGFCYPFENKGGGVADTPLDTTEVTAIEAGVGREVLLRDISFLAQASEIPAYALADVHR